MQNRYEDIEKRNAMVIAISQEDTDLESAGKFLAPFKPKPRFDLVHDLKHEKTPRYDHTTIYIIDKRGVIRQIMPGFVTTRPSWDPVLMELDRIIAETARGDDRKRKDK